MPSLENTSQEKTPGSFDNNIEKKDLLSSSGESYEDLKKAQNKVKTEEKTSPAEATNENLDRREELLKREEALLARREELLKREEALLARKEELKTASEEGGESIKQNAHKWLGGNVVLASL